MTGTLYIDRLSLTLHGVSEDMAAAAMEGLEAALARRLGAMRPHGGRDIPALSLRAADLPRGADAAALRGLIADRLAEALAATNQTAEAG
ncbi:hypothetical protein SAMN05421688_0858 [Poseidonocella pacifica]|uniref:Uncharacterized protein n=1 Tax=Poseidonocella pacifica TaxID=871651 RepID=A0A1I0VRA5_9RHOB|nr:hypothetical protein [Poseidonocella pacifica]SFA78420.1 hypothetical protein SAMN05421688_0858 [Poseidonocella pacifica]